VEDALCGACHVDRFASFPQGHPEFEDYPPHPPGTPLAFSHARHSGEHFAATHTPFSCARCHVPDAAGRTMEAAPFEEACAQCHAREVTFAADAAVVVWEFPLLDVESLEDEALRARWPNPGTHRATWRPEQAFLALLPAEVLALLRAWEATGPLKPGRLEAASPEAKAAARAFALALLDAYEAERSRAPWLAAPPERIDRFHGVRFVPRGHADPVATEVLRRVVARGEGAVESDVLKSCLKCHRVEREGDAHVVRWQARERPRGGLVRFSHRPHVAAGGWACASCHAGIGTPRGEGEGEFAPLRRESCARCHDGRQASAACLGCHRYHAAPQVAGPAPGR